MEHEQLQDDVISALQQQIDELSESNLLLKEQLARKEQFTAMIAHELRSPLTPIINYAHIVARSNQRPETIERGTNIIISQAWRLSRLVSDLLDSSRLTSGQFTLACNPCDAVKLVKETVEQLRPIAPYHKFVIDVPDT
ncbi:MAG TPA: histidine kinase dimerization/phospho-acceptor domain-containing protein, partial [Ktedonobacteraceae bacterium]|nr:histidine kinase dimerization/phospho-acceptor domain-containing protein [Ktedonobacteraceae bacterium]